MEGMDLDDTEEATCEEPPLLEPKPYEQKKLHSPAKQSADAAEELEAARKERLELLAAERGKLLANNEREPATVEGQLDYLLQQSDVFAHFLAGESLSFVSLHRYKRTVCIRLTSFPRRFRLSCYLQG